MTSTTGKVSLFALGFRPFYLVAALFSTVALPLWLAMMFAGIVPEGGLVGVFWHSHEMLFGYTAAVMAGFLLTAVRNWTGLPTPTGMALALLVLLWCAPRVLAVTGPTMAFAVLDLLFLPALAWVTGMPIWKDKNQRNYKVLLVLLALTIANLLFHLGNLRLIGAIWQSTSMNVSLDLIAVLMALIAGRVIPAFTRNAIPDADPSSRRSLEVIAIGTLVAVLILDLAGVVMVVPEPVWLGVLAVSVVAHLWRWLLWQPLCTVRNPLLFMLPLGYLWIPVALALRLLSFWLDIPSATAVHALSIGAAGGLTLAMMMRSALGHTGRPLRAGWTEMAAIALVNASAVLRIMAAVVNPASYRDAVMISGVLWSLAFAIFLFRYLPILVLPRVDGKPG